MRMAVEVASGQDRAHGRDCVRREHHRSEHASSASGLVRGLRHEIRARPSWLARRDVPTDHTATPPGRRAVRRHAGHFATQREPGSRRTRGLGGTSPDPGGASRARRPQEVLVRPRTRTPDVGGGRGGMLGHVADDGDRELGLHAATPARVEVFVRFAWSARRAGAHAACAAGGSCKGHRAAPGSPRPGTRARRGERTRSK